MRIFSKLFLLLLALAIVPLALAAGVFFHSSHGLRDRLVEQNRATGDEVSSKTADVLREQVERTHLKIIREKAAGLAAFFETINKAAILEARLIEQYLATDIVAPDSLPLYEADEMVALKKDPEFFRSAFAVKPYTMFKLAPGVDRAAVQPKLDRLRQLGSYFAHAKRTIPGCATIYLGHRDGFALGYPGGTPYKPDWDPRLRPWYQSAQKNGSLTWTERYVSSDRGDLVITCANPVFDPRSGELVAVAAIDVKKAELTRDLFAIGELNVSEAVLLDQEGHVRVSAVYEDAQAKLNMNALLATDLKDPAFNTIFKKIQANPGQVSGFEVRDSPGDGDASIYTYASVPFGAVEAADASAPAAQRLTWYYVVKSPLEPILRPARQIKADIGRATIATTGAIEGAAARLGVVILVMTSGVALLVLYVAWAAARSATRPLIDMQRVAKRIGTGDLEQQVAVASHDEIGELGDAINTMVAGLRERLFIKQTFQRYVAASVVEHLLKDPTKLSLGGEKTNLTVFFSDLRGFTSVAEKLSPEATIEILNDYLNVMTETILAEEGTLDKYMGDAILAFWGAPLARADDALRACRVALAQQKRLAGLWEGWRAKGLPLLDMRIGIQTGPAIVGNIGSIQQMNYTVVGDNINLGSRLEGANSVYGTRIMIGPETREAAGAAIETRELDLLTVKGKKEMVRVYELLGLAGEVPPQRLAGYRRFEAALADYRLQRWDEAEAGFRATIAALGMDRASEVFMERLAAYREHPPGPAWMGEYVMKGK
jgi:class 3 adenylate cyclase